MLSGLDTGIISDTLLEIRRGDATCFQLVWWNRVRWYDRSEGVSSKKHTKILEWFEPLEHNTLRHLLLVLLLGGL
jgi:hypothetical protein